jgi:hypothetical protein
MKNSGVNMGMHEGVVESFGHDGDGRDLYGAARASFVHRPTPVAVRIGAELAGDARKEHCDVDCLRMVENRLINAVRRVHLAAKDKAPAMHITGKYGVRVEGVLIRRKAVEQVVEVRRAA